MRPRDRILPFIIASLVLLVLYAWTFTGGMDVAVRVDGGVCTAAIYGRTSTIPCPGLNGGTVAVYIEQTKPESDLLGWFAPPAIWDGLRLYDPDGRPLANSAALPDSFVVSGRLNHPDEPGGLIFLRPGADSGWVFILSGRSRSGEWWEWSSGQPSTPLVGITIDTPFLVQAQSFLRLLLGGWQGAVVLIIVAWGMSRLGLIGASAISKVRPSKYTELEGANWNDGAVSKQRGRSTPTAMRRSGTVLFSARVLLPVLILFTFAVALHVSVDVLERLPHVQDSLTYLFQARTLVGGELAAPAPPLVAPDESPHFRQEFLLVRDGRWFGKYPPGFPAILALGVVAGGHWLMNPLLAALTVALIHALAQELYRDGGFKSAVQTNTKPQERQSRISNNPKPAPLNTIDWFLYPLLLATSPFFLVMSGSLMAHPAELLWTALFMTGWAKALRQGRRRWALVAGVAIGMLFLTRQITAVSVGLSFGGGLLAAAIWRKYHLAATAPPFNSDNPGIARPLRRFQPYAPLLAVLLVAAFPFVLAFFAHQAAVTGDPFTDPRLLYWPYDRVGFGPQVGEPENVYAYWESDAGPAIQWTTDLEQPPRGHTPSRGLYNLGRNVIAIERYLFGWPTLFTLAFTWLAFLLRRTAAADWVLLLVVVVIGAGYVTFWASGIAYGPRYFYAALPALVLLTARGVGALAATAGRRPMAVLVLLLMGYNLLNLPGWIESFRGYNFISGEPRASVEAAVTSPALVFVSVSQDDWWEYGAFFIGNSPHLDGDFVYARDLGRAENDRLRAVFPDRAAYLWRDGQIIPLGP